MTRVLPPPASRLEPGVERRSFEQLELGEVFELPSTTLSSDHFSAFQLLSGDGHPMHYDPAECRDRGHRDILAHGLMVSACGAAGAGAFPYVVEESILGMLEQTTRFHAPVMRGDTLHAKLTVAQLRRQRTTGVAGLELEIHNQDGSLVASGSHTYLLRLSPSESGT